MRLYHYSWKGRKSAFGHSVMDELAALKMIDYLKNRSMQITHCKGETRPVTKFTIRYQTGFSAIIESISPRRALRLIRQGADYTRIIQLALFPDGEDLTEEEKKTDPRWVQS